MPALKFVLPLRRGCSPLVLGGIFAFHLSFLAAVSGCSADRSRTDAAPADVHPGAPQPLGAVRGGTSSGQRRDQTVIAIFAELRQDPLTRGQDVTVTAEDTTVILAGSVPSAAAHDRAVEIARAHLGAFTLLDSLAVAGRL